MVLTIRMRHFIKELFCVILIIMKTNFDSRAQIAITAVADSQ